MKIYLSGTKEGPYLLGNLGYNLFGGDNIYAGEAILGGGIYYGFGGGILLQGGLLIEGLYSINNGSVEIFGYDPYMLYYKYNFDIKYSKFNVFLGHNF